jgi:hypothetical protein
VKAVAAAALLLALVLLPSAVAGGGMGPVGPMTVARAGHAAARLPSGEVLVTGGCTTPGCEGQTASAELYEPGPRRFVRARSMTRARVGHAAIALRDGRVLVAGGWSGRRPTASAELYLPRLGRFATTGSMRTGRGGFSATRLRDGRVLVVGGVDGERTLATAELYDPRRGRFVAAGRMAIPRSAHAAALLADGRVLVTGGSNDAGVTASAEIWDPRTRRFSRAGRMTVARHKHAAVSLRDGRVLVVGGSDASDWRGRYASTEVYEPRRGRFARTGSMRESRFKLPDAVVRLRSADVLVAGGGTHVERYNPVSGRFYARLPLGAALSFSTATELVGGYVLIAGGYDGRIVPTDRAWFHGLP